METALIAIVIIAIFIGGILAADEIRMRHERSTVCLAMAKALDRCPPDMKPGAEYLAEQVAALLDKVGWGIRST